MKRGMSSTSKRIYFIPKSRLNKGPGGMRDAAEAPRESESSAQGVAAAKKSARDCRHARLDPVLVAFVCSGPPKGMCEPNGCASFKRR